MSDIKTFYITTPIFYPNAKLHMGHAYTTTISDVLARYHRLIGDKVYFLAGSDENTQKVVQASTASGKDPLIFLNDIIENFTALYKKLNISHDQFIRTTNQELHWAGAQKLWIQLDTSGDIYKKAYEGLYCIGHEAFITQKELVDGMCPEHGTPPEVIKEENYFFRLSRYTDVLTQKIASDEFLITPEARKNEILSFISQGLEDVSFSRPRKKEWPQGLGVPVPGDDTQIMYVWCDALANYITALGYGTNQERMEFWPANVQVVGKDILRFHAAIWPAMLISAGLALPRSLLVHGLITSGGKKMSKTLGNVIDPETLLASYGTDAVRYHLTGQISPFEDGSLTVEGFRDSYNAHLANGLGNLVSRIMTLAETHLVKAVEPDEEKYPSDYAWEPLTRFEINQSLNKIWQIIQDVDQEIADTKPYKVVKEKPTEGKELIVGLVLRLEWIARMLAPFMPDTSDKIRDAVRQNKKPDTLFPRKD